MSLCLRLQMYAGIGNEEVKGKLERIGDAGGGDNYYQLRFPSVFTGIVLDNKKIGSYGFRDVNNRDKVEIQDLGGEKYKISVRVIRTGQTKTIDLSYK